MLGIPLFSILNKQSFYPMTTLMEGALFLNKGIFHYYNDLNKCEVTFLSYFISCHFILY